MEITQHIYECKVLCWSSLHLARTLNDEGWFLHCRKRASLFFGLPFRVGIRLPETNKEAESLHGQVQINGRLKSATNLGEGAGNGEIIVLKLMALQTREQKKSKLGWAGIKTCSVAFPTTFLLSYNKGSYWSTSSTKASRWFDQRIN